MRTVELVESRETVIDLTSSDAQQLSKLGEHMASTATWWGTPRHSDGDRARSVLRVTPARDGRYLVVVMNMVGIVRLGQVQLEIAPKIPASHFIYLVKRSSLVPRETSTSVSVASSDTLQEILARWFLVSAENLMRRGLRTDYQEFTGAQDALRGRLMAVETATEMLQARPIVHCTYEELTEDAALNRILLAACQQLARLTLISVDSRSRARKLAYRMDSVGRLRPSDLLVRVDRVSQSYGAVISLAHLILSGCGVSLRGGTTNGTAFLIRTPDLIEDGLRTLVSEALPEISVKKQRLMLNGTKLSVNPDLVLNDGQAVGDAKYRILSSEWHRDVLYQSLAFATAFRSHHGLVIGFTGERGAGLPAKVQVGNVHTQALAWNSCREISPEFSANQLKSDLAGWWSLVSASPQS